MFLKLYFDESTKKDSHIGKWARMFNGGTYWKYKDQQNIVLWSILDPSGVSKFDDENWQYLNQSVSYKKTWAAVYCEFINERVS